MKLDIKRIIWITAIVLFAVFARVIFEYTIDYFKLQYSISEFIYLSLRFLVTALVVLIWINIVVQSENTISKLPWLLILTLEPFIGLSLFLTLGRSYRKSERYLNKPFIQDGRYLIKEPLTNFESKEYTTLDSEITDIYKLAFHQTLHHAYLNNSKIDVLNDGEKFYQSLIKEVKNAKEFIFLEYYILRTDQSGKELLNLLAKKAQEGVEVKFLYDAIGSVFLDRLFIRNIRKQGVDIRAFERVFFGFFNTKVNYRNHRKLAVIDGKVAFVGGMNIGNEYRNKDPRFVPFRDTTVKVSGKVIQSITQLFLRDYFYVSGEIIDDNKYFMSQEVENDSLVQVIPSGPDFRYPPIKNAYIKMINNAKQRIQIMTPYLALDQEMINALVIASKSGVTVEIIIPKKPDKISVYQVTKSFVQELLEANIHIYMYQEKFPHAKVFIMDERLASVGTYNLDNRSARINFEMTLLLYHTGVNELVKDFNNDLSNSQEIQLDIWKKRSILLKAIEGLFNLFSPIV